MTRQLDLIETARAAFHLASTTNCLTGNIVEAYKQAADAAELPDSPDVLRIAAAAARAAQAMALMYDTALRLQDVDLNPGNTWYNRADTLSLSVKTRMLLVFQATLDASEAAFRSIAYQATGNKEAAAEYYLLTLRATARASRTAARVFDSIGSIA